MKQTNTFRPWLFTLLLVLALVVTALLTTAVTNALTGGQGLDQLRSYYIYLPSVFHR